MHAHQGGAATPMTLALDESGAERLWAGVHIAEVPGTVLAMWLFHKAYGLA